MERNTDLQVSDAMDVPGNGMLCKVPEITIYFWIIKVLCTTVGETASDFLNVNLGLGLTGTSIAMGVILAVVLIFQFRARKYIPGIYWLAVVLISIFGTLITDNLTDSMGIPLELSTVAFSIALALTFIAWYAKEGTLSIHSIFTRRRELFYWLAILFTFALGTAAGDLMAEKLGLGYLLTGIIVCAVIFIVTIAWRFRLDAVLAFWVAYILTRPLGASLGDYLSQSQANGGLGLGATITSVVFLLAILAVVMFLSITKRDLITNPSTTIAAKEEETAVSRQVPAYYGNRFAVVWQVVVVVAVLVLVGGAGYLWRSTQLRNHALANVTQGSPLGDLSAFRQIAEDTLGLVRTGNLSAAKDRIADLESAWDNAEAQLNTMNPEKWSTLDDSIDDVLRKLRAVRQDTVACSKSLESLISLFNALDNRKQMTSNITIKIKE